MVGNEKRWFAVARTATKPENMQGFHEDNMLFIVDEASGVADPIMEAILGTLSGANNKLLMCGNPTRTSGTFMMLSMWIGRYTGAIRYRRQIARGPTNRISNLSYGNMGKTVMLFLSVCSENFQSRKMMCL